MRRILVAAALAFVSADAALAMPATVIDGDTIVVSGVTVRLKGVDAAELGTLRGEVARGEMLAIVGKGTVTCQLTGEKTHGREVGFCWTEKLDINREIIARGYALACPRYSKRYVADEQPEAVAAQARARYCLETAALVSEPLLRRPEPRSEMSELPPRPRSGGGNCMYPDDLDSRGGRCGKRASTELPGGL